MPHCMQNYALQSGAVPIQSFGVVSGMYRNVNYPLIYQQYGEKLHKVSVHEISFLGLLHAFKSVCVCEQVKTISFDKYVKLTIGLHVQER